MHGHAFFMVYFDPLGWWGQMYSNVASPKCWYNTLSVNISFSQQCPVPSPKKRLDFNGFHGISTIWPSDSSMTHTEKTCLRDGGLIATGSFIHLGLVLSDFQLEHPTDLEKYGTSLWKNTTGISTVYIYYTLYIYIYIYIYYNYTISYIISIIILAWRSFASKKTAPALRCMLCGPPPEPPRRPRHRHGDAGFFWRIWSDNY